MLIGLRGFTSVAELARDLGYARSEKLARVMRSPGAAPNAEVLADVANKYVNIDPMWLLTGKGHPCLDKGDRLLTESDLTLGFHRIPNPRTQEPDRPGDRPDPPKPARSVRSVLDSQVAEPQAPYGRPVITVNEEGQPRIVMLDSRAAAGLPAHHGDAEFYRDQPVMHLPGYRYKDKGIIAIQVTGDSMSPTINHEDWLIARPLINPREEIKEGYVHLLVTRDGAVAKRLFKAKGRAAFVCKSDNPDYPSYEQEVDGHAAVYVVLATLSEDLSNKGGGIRERLAAVERDLLALKSQFKPL